MIQSNPFTLIFMFFFMSNWVFSQDSIPLDCCNNSWSPYYYGEPALKYQGGFYALKEDVQNGYGASLFISEDNNSGILVIQFKVDCNGKVSDLNIACYDFNYQEIEMNPEIVKALSENVSKLEKWILGKDDHGITLCYHKFLSFKISNGSITEILPN
jgi:hypothetical protein